MKAIKVVLCITLIALPGCASALKARSKRPSNPHYFGDYKSIPAGTDNSVPTMRDDLRRYFWATVDVVPATPALVEASARAEGKRKMDSEDTIEKNVRGNLALLTDGKTCYWVDIESHSDIKRALFQNWAAKVRDAKGDLTPVTFVGFRQIPEYDSLGYWKNSATACITKVINGQQASFIVFPPGGEAIEFNWTGAE